MANRIDRSERQGIHISSQYCTVDLRDTIETEIKGSIQVMTEITVPSKLWNCFDPEGTTCTSRKATNIKIRPYLTLAERDVISAIRSDISTALAAPR